MTVCNLLILGAVGWLLLRNSERLFPSRAEDAQDALPFAAETGRPGGKPGGTRRLSDPSGDPAASPVAVLPENSAPDAGSLLPSARALRRVIETPPALLDSHPAAGTLFQISTGGEARQTFTFIPAGSFIMGSPPGEIARSDDETQRRVEIAEGLWLAGSECTIGLWRSVMDSTPEAAAEGDSFPVHTVSWDEVAGGENSFIARMNRRGLVPAGWRFALPTQEQWEYACRAGTVTPFSFGGVLDGTLANCDGNLPYGTGAPGPWLARTAQVGSYPPNPWGLYDMHGNVWEWCAGRIRGGGGWRFGAAQCRSANRETGGEHGDDMLGFRIAIVRAE